MDIAAAISSTATLLGIAKGAVAARDDAKAQQAITDVQLKLLEVSTAALALSQANIALTDEIRLLKNEAHQSELKTREREGYVLTEVCPGHYAYQSQPSRDGTNAPPHCFCQPCYDKGVKSVLRYSHNQRGEWNSENMVWECAIEKNHTFSHYPK